MATELALSRCFSNLSAKGMAEDCSSNYSERKHGIYDFERLVVALLSTYTMLIPYLDLQHGDLFPISFSTKLRRVFDAEGQLLQAPRSFTTVVLFGLMLTSSIAMVLLKGGADTAFSIISMRWSRWRFVMPSTGSLFSSISALFPLFFIRSACTWSMISWIFLCTVRRLFLPLVYLRCKSARIVSSSFSFTRFRLIRVCYAKAFANDCRVAPARFTIEIFYGSFERLLPRPNSASSLEVLRGSRRFQLLRGESLFQGFSLSFRSGGADAIADAQPKVLNFASTIFPSEPRREG